MKLFRTAIIVSFFPTFTLADVPKVVTDVGPINSLVATVMDGVGKPVQIVPPASNPHSFALRPSQAAQLQAADLVFWTGDALIPQLHDNIISLAANAGHHALLEYEKTHLITFAGEHVEGNGHDDHQDEDGHDDHDHSAGAIDPHAWLAPENLEIWLAYIAEVLSASDPENAATYQANAAAGIAAIVPAVATATQTLADAPAIVVFHDTLGYYEQEFPLGPVITIPLGDGYTASVADVKRLEAEIAEHNPKCALVDPFGMSRGLEKFASDVGLELRPLDALASNGETYTQVLTGIADSISACR